MLTASDLASMRETIEDSLPDTAVIKSRAWVSDGGGGGTTTYTPSGTVECRITPASVSPEAVKGERLHPDTEYVLTFPYDTAIATDSIIALDGRDYSVTAKREPRSWAVSLRVEAKEVS